MDSRRPRLIAGCVFLALLLIYLGTMRGNLIHGDDNSMFQVAASLVERRSFVLPDPPEPAGLAWGVDGRPYSKYGIGLSLIAAPFYWIGTVTYAHLAEGRIPWERQTYLIVITLLTNPLLAAATSLVLWWLVWRLGYGVRIATATALLLGIGTPLWYYANSFMSEPLTSLGLLGSVAAAWRAEPGRRRWWLLVAGFVAGLLIATRSFNVVILPILGAYLSWRYRHRLWELGFWLAPIAGWGLLIGLYNYSRFGNALESGYGGELQAFNTSLAEGAYGLLLSPGKGLAFYCPLLLLAIAGARPFWRRDRALLLVIGLCCLVYVVGYGRFYDWWGGGNWGPRYVVPVIPLLMPLVAAGLGPLSRWRWSRVTMGTLIVLSLVIQLGSVLINFATYYLTMAQWYSLWLPFPASYFAHNYRQIHDPVFSPIAAHLWLLFTGRRWILAGLLLNSGKLLAAQCLAVATAMAILLSARLLIPGTDMRPLAWSSLIERLSHISQRSVLLLIFAVVLLGHTASSNVTSTDSRWTIHTAMSLVTRGDADLDEYAHLFGDEYGIEKVGDHYYTWYPIGVALTAAPVVALIDKTSPYLLGFSISERLLKQAPSHEFPGKIERFVASFLVALASAVLYWICRQFAGRKESLIAVAVFAFGTSVWSTASRALWQHAPSMLYLTIALALIIRARVSPSIIRFAGIPLALSYLVRPVNSVSILFFTIYVVLCYRRYLAMYLAGIFLVIVPFVLFSEAVYNSLLPPYFQASRLMNSQTFGEALAGNLISPSRGLFVYSPILVFCAYGMVVFVRDMRTRYIGVLLFCIVVVHWLVISSFPHWWGGWSFGPRFFTDVLPFLTVFLVQALVKIRQMQTPRRLVFQGVFAVLFAMSFFVNYRGANQEAVVAWSGDPVSVDEAPRRLWDWRDAQFLRGLQRPRLPGL